MVFEGTALYVDTDHDDLMWAWEIPVAEHRQSIGVVMNLDRFRSIQGTRGSSAEIMIEVLARFDRFHRTSSHDLDGVRSRTYRPAVPSRVAGANWISIGEAAGFVDPLTSTGVTAALRHGAEAAAIIIEDGSSPGGTRRRLGRYDQRVRAMAGLYNLGIERLIYEPELRSALGTRAASVAYLIPGYITNALYARLEPTTRPRMLVLSMVLRAFRFWVRAWLTVARLAARTPHSLGTFGVER
jgi:flavin-dependent dehydrogenase